MHIEIIRQKTTKSQLAKLAHQGYGDMIKAIADLDKGWIAVGGDLHADGEMVLLNTGSDQENLWGFNLFPEKTGEDRLEYSALINIRPRHGNPAITIEKEEIRRAIRQLVDERIDWTQ